MYSTQIEDYNTIITGDMRSVVAYSSQFPNYLVISAAIKDTIGDAGEFTFGAACSKELTLKLFKPTVPIDYDSQKIALNINVDVNGVTETIPAGTYWVKTTETNNDFKTVTLTCYDGMMFLEEEYTPSITLPATLEDIAIDLSAQIPFAAMGIDSGDDPFATIFDANIDWDSYADYPVPALYSGYTLRQTLGYIAGCMGGFARFDRAGKITIQRYASAAVDITRALQLLEGFHRNTKTDITITSLVTGTRDNVIAIGEGSAGIAINHENPYMTQELAQKVYDECIFDGTNYLVTYTPCTVEWRGNPALDAGDIVTATDADNVSRTAYVMESTTVIDGGCRGEIKSYGNSEISANFTTQNPILDRLTKQYRVLDQAILTATEKITGNTGGHVVLHKDESGQPYEILIMDSADINSAVNVWRWNSAGLGHSSTGYNGTYALAMTADGQIIGTLIAAGTIAGASLDIDTLIEEINAFDGSSAIDATHIKVGDSTLEGAIEAYASRSGGSNRIRNSVGRNGTEYWNTTGTIGVVNTAEVKNSTIGQYAFSVNGSVSQTVALTLGIPHMISYKYKKQSTATLVVSVGTDYAKTITSAGTWISESYTFIPTLAEQTLSITSTGGASLIGDLMLCAGISTVWQQASGEMYSATVKIDPNGMSVDQAGATTRTIIDSAGTRIVDKNNTSTIIAEYTREGTKTNTLISEGQIRAGKMRFIPLDDEYSGMIVINN